MALARAKCAAALPSSSAHSPRDKQRDDGARAAAIAQLGERQTEDLKVPGSIPGLGILCGRVFRVMSYFSRNQKLKVMTGTEIRIRYSLAG